MPGLYQIPLKLEMENLLRRIGLSERRNIEPRLQGILLELIDEFHNDRFVAAALSYGIHPVETLTPRGRFFDQIAAPTGNRFLSVFSETTEVAAAVATIGPMLERQVADFFRAEEPLKGFLLDGIGNALVDSLAGEVCKLIEDEASSKGLQVGSPLSPGMFDIPLEWQGELLELASAANIGVSLNSASLLIPLKTASMLIAMGPSMDRSMKGDDCQRCGIRETCGHRRRSPFSL